MLSYLSHLGGVVYYSCSDVSCDLRHSAVISATCPLGGRACNGYIEPKDGDDGAGESMASRIFSDVYNLIVQEVDDKKGT